MAILIDPPAWPAHGTLWSHLVSDTSTDELHAFARLLGFPRRSFDLDHYDVAAANFDRAVALGALPVTGREVVLRLRESGLRVRQVDRDAVTPLRRRQYLHEQWGVLGVQLGVASTAVDVWKAAGEDLVARWNEPHRRYHDERHLEDVLLALDHLETRGERISPATLLAAWFHDAVYTGATGDDERGSASLAVSALAALGLGAGLIDEVCASILATTPGDDDREGDGDGDERCGQPETRPATPVAHLLDADLWIFASSPSRYAEYAAAVRSEYAHVPDADFAAGRARILEAYLDRPSVYFTAAARHLWESRARANVAAEVARLRG